MVETVCSVCGNKKSFENSNIGRTFKCPNCSNAVKIESVGSQLNEGTQVNLDSFTDEIRKAEAQKEAEKLAILEKQEKERILKEEENKQKTMIRLLIFFYPIGLYIMWKKRYWTQTIRWIVTGIGILPFVLYLTGAIVPILIKNKNNQENSVSFKEEEQPPISQNSQLPSKQDSKNDPMIYPEASLRRLSMDELSGLNKDELRIMRNAIYARHSYIFNSTDLKSYFSKQSWYVAQYKDVSKFLTPIEKSNIDLILSASDRISKADQNTSLLDPESKIKVEDNNDID